MSCEIVFTNTLDIEIADDYRPTPASRSLPAWYKSMPQLMPPEVAETVTAGPPFTVKKCVPFFDALTSGYIIPTYTDVKVSQQNTLPYYEWPRGEPIDFHPVEQADKHPLANDAPFPKWKNPWGIKTPKGYSCLLVPPLNAPNPYFTAFSGVVDTDRYHGAINFPFVLNDRNFEGLIPAGTPIAQVIPFRRDSFKMRFGDVAELRESKTSVARVRSVFARGYRAAFWERKEYR